MGAPPASTRSATFENTILRSCWLLLFDCSLLPTHQIETLYRQDAHFAASKEWKFSLAGVDGQVNQTVAVSPFVIVPGDDLVEVVIEEDAGLGINRAGSLARDKVGGDNLVFSVVKDSLHVTFGGLLEGGEDFAALSSLLSTEGQVND
jgi:hypothetical protein